MSSNIELLLKENLTYAPTLCQEKAMANIGNFMRSKNNDSVFILNGYAGTGKTTLISVLVNVLTSLNIDFVLLAPTGRAAKVISTYAHKRAYTIHKYIYWIFTAKEGGLRITLQKNLHKNALFIVDESSMIGTSSSSSLNGSGCLLDDLIAYVKQGQNCNLFFVGDMAQLPPVGENLTPALDAKYLEKNYGFNVYTSTFKTVVRQQYESGILENATTLRKSLNYENKVLPKLSLGGFTDIERVPGVELSDILDSSYSQQDIHNVIVLCRSNKRANMYNQQIRNRILFREDVIATGDILMVVKNNYFCLPDGHSAGFVANGDIIEIMRIRKVYALYGFDFADVTIRMMDYPDDLNFETTILLNTISTETPSLSSDDYRKLFNEILLDYEDEKTYKAKMDKMRVNPHLNALQIKFAYAITTHKSQGGQWHTVFVDHGFLDKEKIDNMFIKWLYTSFTRATDKLYLINFDEDFFID